MCLAAISLAPNTERPLTIVANRDEFHSRPTAPLSWWRSLEGVRIAGGRDLKAGGTWLGMDVNMRWGLLLNRPEGATDAPNSRGDLIPQWLASGVDAVEFMRDLEQRKARYRPFNLVIGDTGSALCLSSPSGRLYRYAEGIHAFSNCEPESDNPRVKRILNGFGGTLKGGAFARELMAMLNPADPEDPVFIRSQDYGTGRSTVLQCTGSRVEVLEQQWHPDGSASDYTRLSFAPSRP